MKIKLKVHPNSSVDKFVKISDSEFEIWVKEKPLEGKANKYLEKFLKKETGISGRIVSGFNSRVKYFEVHK